MTDIEWGPAIAVDGKRPGWLCSGEWRRVRTLAVGEWQTADIESPGDSIPDMNEWNWGDITAIRLPADHPHYRQPAPEKGLIIPAGMMPWHGGQKPIDWSGEAVMFRNGEIRHAPAGAIWKMGWDHSYGMGDIVAYSVATPQADTKPDVTARMEALVRAIAADSSSSVVVDHQDEARAIVALLPEPVDPDLIEARNVVAEVHAARGFVNQDRTDLDAGKLDGEQPMLIARAALARGRELALAGETGK